MNIHIRRAVQDEVRLAYSKREITRHMQRMRMDHIRAEQKARRWYRRLWRWVKSWLS